MFEPRVADGVLRLARPGTRFLATGPGGGYREGDAAYNVTVPEGFDRTDLAAYVGERLDAAGFAGAGGGVDGPALLTGVEQRHARGARAGDAVAWVTAGLSNPAALPVDESAPAGAGSGTDAREQRRPGTVNVVVGTTRCLDDGALATLLAGAAEAKAATLQATTGFTGTTSDAVVAATDPGGEPATFAGSATAVGAAVRACVRDALLASLRSRYDVGDIPDSVAGAEHGTVVDVETTVRGP